jgi:hypothetical protein
LKHVLLPATEIQTGRETGLYAWINICKTHPRILGNISHDQWDISKHDFFIS